MIHTCMFWFTGFLSSPENNFTGNNGLLDQVTAMKWIHSNIHYFDGDESRVTIVGHSAGAGDVGLHLVSPLTKGLLFRYWYITWKKQGLMFIIVKLRT